MTIIRLAGSEDIPAISRLLVDVATRHITHEFGAGGTAELRGGMQPAAIANRLLRGYRYHVALDEGTIVGVIGMRGYSHIYHLFVAEKAQRKGIGRLLWQRARQASQSEVPVMAFTVFSSRYAEAFYKSLGFRRTGAEQTRRGVTAIPMKLVI